MSAVAPAHGSAKCPAHDDSKASLTYRQGDDGKALVHCHAGCSFAAIIDALGLKTEDLNGGNGHHAGRRIVATYPYRNEAGVLLFEVVRFDEPKGFRQRRPDGNGGHVWSMQGVRRVLFRLPEIIEAIKVGSSIFVAEGEKDVETIIAWGLDATTNAGGAGKWKADYSETLRGAHVVIIPDNDEPGRKHGQHVADSLSGIAGSIRVVTLPAGKDVSEWRDQHGGTRELLLELVDTAGDSPATEVRDASAQDSRPIIHFTDQGNAQRLVALHGADLRYCWPQRCWYVWDDGTRWRRDDTGAVYRRAKDVPRALYREAAELDGADARKVAARWAALSESQAKLEAMVSLARSEPGVPITPEQLDRDPWLLAVENGSLDLRTGELHPHRREDLITKLAPVEYDPAAICPRWIAFLERVQPTIEVREYIQRAVGYSLTGDVSEQVLFFEIGPGNNGKSTMLGTVRAVLGDYAAHVSSELLMARRGDHHSTELADLWGIRLATTIETEENRRLAEAEVKALTGGEPIRARRLYQDSQQHEPTHKIWLGANYRPIIHGTDPAIWRRLHIIPYLVAIPEHERDLSLGEKLKGELPGILAWAVRGCLDWQHGGLRPPATVKAAVDSYRADQDLIGHFIADRCVLVPRAFVQASDLYRAFRAWCATTGERETTQHIFGRRLGDRGLSSEHTRTGSCWRGIGLRDNETGGVTDCDPFRGVSGTSYSEEEGEEKLRKQAQKGHKGSHDREPGDDDDLVAFTEDGDAP
jgi:putative DNA primase/helicase